MNIVKTIINLLSLTFCLSTAGSIIVHDTNVDKALITGVTSRAATIENVVARPGNDPHTHSERASLYQAVRDLHSSQPRVRPRNQEDKSYIRAKPSARGHHPFDNYTLPYVG